MKLVYSDDRNLAKEEEHRKRSSNPNPKERRSFTTIAQQHYRIPFKKALLQFIMELDPFLAMLKLVMAEMMRIEAEANIKHAIVEVQNCLLL